MGSGFVEDQRFQDAGPRPNTQGQNGSFRKLGVPYFGILPIRILLFRVYIGVPLFSETPNKECGMRFLV